VAEQDSGKLEAAREALRKYQLKKAPTKTEQIIQLLPEIATLKARPKATWGDVAAALRGTLDVSPQLLRTTVAQHAAAKTKKKKPPAVVTRAAQKPKPAREAAPAAPASDKRFGKREL